MSTKEFDTNLLRFIAAELFFSLSMQVSREMYEKSYFSLGVVEKAQVDQMVLGTVQQNVAALRPEIFHTNPSPNPIGFEGPRKEGSEKK